MVEPDRDLDHVQTSTALHDQEISGLRFSFAASVDELSLLKTERDSFLRDRDAQLTHMVDSVIGLPPSVGPLYGRRRG